MIKVVVCGASGRMGQTIGRMVKESPDLELVGGIDLHPGTFFGADIVATQDIDKLLKSKKPDVLIDFTIAQCCCRKCEDGGKKPRGAHCGNDRIYPGAA